MSLDERPRSSARPAPREHYNSLPRTSIEGALERVDSLTKTPATFSRYSRLCSSLAKGRSCTSASRSLLAFSSTLGLLPGAFPGARERLSRTAFTQRLTEERLTESAGCLALAHAPLLDGLDYLLSEIFRIGIHGPMVTQWPRSLQAALDSIGEPPG